MKNLTYTITNPDLFDNVLDLDFDNCKKQYGFTGTLESIFGTVSIEMPGIGWIDISGVHGVNDYCDEYGFKIIEE